MQRVKFIRSYKQYRQGDIESLSNNEAFGLIDSGYAIISKDMTAQDYQSKPKRTKKIKGIVTK